MTGCPLLDSEFVARQHGKRLPCERLAEENDKLLMRLNAEHIVRQNVERENAKLRELVRDMNRAICCLVVLGDAYVERHEDELCALDDRMSELGVEV